MTGSPIHQEVWPLSLAMINAAFIATAASRWQGRHGRANVRGQASLSASTENARCRS
jgi:hypothetical protein